MCTCNTFKVPYITHPSAQRNVTITLLDTYAVYNVKLYNLIAA